MIQVPFQSAPAPEQLTIQLLFLGVVVSVLLSVVILVKGIQGYRASRDPALLGLAGGILLLSGVPLLLNVGLLTLTAAEETTVRVVEDLSRLSGLGLILYVIYNTQR